MTGGDACANWRACPIISRDVVFESATDDDVSLLFCSVSVLSFSLVSMVAPEEGGDL